MNLIELIDKDYLFDRIKEHIAILLKTEFSTNVVKRSGLTKFLMMAKLLQNKDNEKQKLLENIIRTLELLNGTEVKTFNKNEKKPKKKKFKLSTKRTVSPDSVNLFYIEESQNVLLNMLRWIFEKDSESNDRKNLAHVLLNSPQIFLNETINSARDSLPTDFQTICNMLNEDEKKQFNIELNFNPQTVIELLLKNEYQYLIPTQKIAAICSKKKEAKTMEEEKLEEKQIVLKQNTEKKIIQEEEKIKDASQPLKTQSTREIFNELVNIIILFESR